MNQLAKVEEQQAQQPLHPRDALKKALEGEKFMAALARVVPEREMTKRIVGVVLDATGRNEKLLDCSQVSILRSVLQAGELGLEIGGPLGEAYLVPYQRSWKDSSGRWQKTLEAQCIVGYQGLLVLARRSGEIRKVGAYVVHANDRFRFDLLSAEASHDFDLQADRGPIVGACALIELVSGAKHLEIMQFSDIELIRKRSKTYDSKEDKSSGPWLTDYSEMARKTVLRRALKYVPRSVRISRAFEIDSEMRETAGEFDIAPDLVERAALPAQRSNRSSALAQRIQETKGPSVQDAVVDEPADSGPVDVTPEPQRMREPGEEG